MPNRLLDALLDECGSSSTLYYAKTGRLGTLRHQPNKLQFAKSGELQFHSKLSTMKVINNPSSIKCGETIDLDVRLEPTGVETWIRITPDPEAESKLRENGFVMHCVLLVSNERSSCYGVLVSPVRDNIFD